MSKELEMLRNVACDGDQTVLVAAPHLRRILARMEAAERVCEKAQAREDAIAHYKTVCGKFNDWMTANKSDGDPVPWVGPKELEAEIRDATTAEVEAHDACDDAVAAYRALDAKETKE